MSLDELSLDSGEGIGASAEAPSEKSEKQREQSKKAQAQLQKTQKDEKKAKTDNDELFFLLTRFIKNPLYEELVPMVVLLLQKEYPSRFLLVIIALVFPEASAYLLRQTGLDEKVSTISGLFHSSEKVLFDDTILDPSLREWITLWLTATERFLLSSSASTILSQKLLWLIIKNEDGVTLDSVGVFFRHFFISRNIIISEEKSRAYAWYIISQMRDSLDAHIITLDPELRREQSVDARDLFGV
jgi:hypothetical protein